MKAVIQRVSRASVEIDSKTVGQIAQGLLVLLGIATDDTPEDLEWISHKIVQMRIFDNEQGVMNKSMIDVDGQLLVVSQFTLQASTRKGHRPSYMAAARPEIAEPIYKQSIVMFERLINKTVETGEFGADMQVSLVNDGPVTIWLDSKNRN
jgi:D-tyrosyl-tRNA(Tyr) deacylase